MRKFSTFVCCGLLLTFGWVIGHNDDTKPIAQPVVTYGQIPVDIQMTMLKNTVKSLLNEQSRDRPEPVQVTNNNTTVVKVPYRVIVRDTLYVPLLFIATPYTKELTNDTTDLISQKYSEQVLNTPDSID